MSIFDNFDNHFGGNNFGTHQYHSGMNNHDHDHNNDDFTHMDHSSFGHNDFMTTHDTFSNDFDHAHFSNASSILQHDDPLVHAGSLQFDSMNFGSNLTSHANIFGGQDYFANGVQVASTHANIHGGQDVFDHSGMQVGSTHANIFGGQDVFNQSGTQVGSTHANIFGGQNINNMNHK